MTYEEVITERKKIAKFEHLSSCIDVEQRLSNDATRAIKMLTDSTYDVNDASRCELKFTITVKNRNLFQNSECVELTCRDTQSKINEVVTRLKNQKLLHDINIETLKRQQSEI